MPVTIFRIPLAILLTISPVLWTDIRAGESTDDLFDLPLTDLTNLTVTVNSRLQHNHRSEPFISSTDRTHWDHQGARNTSDVLNHMPSTISLPTLGGGQAVAIRGYASELANRGVATLLDGVPINVYTYGSGEYGTAAIELGVLKQIDLVRGPVSSLYGSDAFHGVISHQTYNSNLNEKHISAAVGSDGFRQGNLRYSSDINDDLRYHFALGASSQPDQNRRYEYTDPASGSPGSSEYAYQYSSQSLLNKITWGDYEQQGELTLLYDRLDTQDYPGMGSHFFSGALIQRDTDFTSQEAEFALLNLRHSINLNTHNEILLQGFFWRSDQSLTFDNRGLIASPNLPPPHKVYVDNTESRGGAEAGWRFSSRNHQTFLGLSHHRLQIIDASTMRKTPAGVVLESSANGYDDALRQITSLTSESESHFGKWRFNYGARVDHYSDFGEYISPRFEMSYDLNEEYALLLRYGRGFRAAIASEQYNSGRVLGDRDIQPESLTSVEAGWQYEHSNLGMHLIGFRSEWDETILLTGVDDPALPEIDATYANGGMSHSFGAELGIEYTGSIFRSHGDISYIVSQDDETDEEYVTFPRVIANLTGGWYWDNDRWQLFFSNRIHGNARATKISATEPSPEKLKTYWRADVNLHYNFSEQTYARLSIRNLFDRENRVPSVWDAPGGLLDESFSVAIEAGYGI